MNRLFQPLKILFNPLHLTFFFLMSVPTITLAEESSAVSVQHFQSIAVYPRMSVPAVVESLNNTKVSTEISGVIAKININVGDIVNKGDLLAQLDSQDYRLLLDRAKAQLKNFEARRALAEYQLERARLLKNQNAASEELVQQRQTELSVLNADIAGQNIAIQQAQRNLDKCIIRAPFRAIVKERIASVGELLSPGMPLVTLVDAEKIEVMAKLQTSDVEAVDGVKTFTFEAQHRQYPLNLRVVSPMLDARERNREARFEFKKVRALAGTAGSVIWNDPAPHLPASIMVKRNGKLGVFVLTEQNTAQFVLTPSAREGRAVKTTLALDTKIITDGRFVLRDGDKVKVQ